MVKNKPLQEYTIQYVDRVTGKMEWIVLIGMNYLHALREARFICDGEIIAVTRAPYQDNT